MNLSGLGVPRLGGLEACRSRNHPLTHQGLKGEHTNMDMAGPLALTFTPSKDASSPRAIRPLFACLGLPHDMFPLHGDEGRGGFLAPSTPSTRRCHRTLPTTTSTAPFLLARGGRQDLRACIPVLSTPVLALTDEDGLPCLHACVPFLCPALGRPLKLGRAIINPDQC